MAWWQNHSCTEYIDINYRRKTDSRSVLCKIHKCATNKKDIVTASNGTTFLVSVV